MVCDLPGLEDDEANCDSAAGGPLVVGRYTFSASPFGTFDQGGNAREWTESAGSAARRVRGGDFASAPGALASAAFLNLPPATADASTGFRVASPAGGVVVALPLGGAVAPLLAFALIGGGWRSSRRRSARGDPTPL